MPVVYLLVVQCMMFAQAGGGSPTALRPAKPATSAKAAAEFRKSQAAFDENRIDQAVRHLQKGLAQDPGNVDAYNDLGTIYFNTNEPLKAVEAFSKMVALEPHGYRGYLNLAFALFSLGRYPEAEAAARRAVDLKAADVRGRYLLGASLALQKKNLAEATAHLKVAAPEMVEARFRLAHVLIEMGELERGMEELQRYTVESAKR